MKIVKALAILILLVPFITANGQQLEYGGWVGVSNYFGDLNTNASFEFIGPGTGLFVRYNMGTRFATRTGINYGKIAFADERTKFPYQNARNLSFESNIYELSSHIEFNFFKYDKEKEALSFTPYLLAGVSVFYFNPVAEFEGKKYALQPLGTEGQNEPGGGKKYARVSFAIPVGGGFKYSFNPYWTIGVEGGYRKTVTDYLDDVSTVYPGVLTANGDNSIANSLSDRSVEVTDAIGKKGKQRGDATKKDDYLFIGITVSYSIIKVRCPKPGKIQ